MEDISMCVLQSYATKCQFWWSTSYKQHGLNLSNIIWGNCNTFGECEVVVQIVSGSWTTDKSQYRQRHHNCNLQTTWAVSHGRTHVDVWYDTLSERVKSVNVLREQMDRSWIDPNPYPKTWKRPHGSSSHTCTCTYSHIIMSETNPDQ
jgi:hypothetical protein